MGSKKLGCFFWLLFVHIAVFAGRLEEAFEALEQRDYFRAKTLFEKELEHHLVGVSYGLSVIYERTDNPFHNLDSAYAAILTAEKHYPDLEKKERERLSKLFVDEAAIETQKMRISEAVYKKVKEVNSIVAYDFFIKEHPHFDRQRVIADRNKRAYAIADSIETPEAYELFLLKYPDAEQAEEARKKLSYAVYRTGVKEGNADSYLRFIKENPKNPYKKEAERKAYDLMTGSRTLKAYENYVRKLPKAHNVAKAWNGIRRLFFTDYSDREIADFLKRYPKYPYRKRLSKDKKRYSAVYYPVRKGNKFGFINAEGKVVVTPKYDAVERFSEGLAAVSLSGKTGYINSQGKELIGFKYDSGEDFNKGMAIVEKGGKYGMINKMGQTVFAFEFDDIYRWSEGFVLAEKDGKFRYYRPKSKLAFKEAFDDASPFKGKRAIVAREGNYGLINTKGDVSIPLAYRKILRRSDSLFLVETEDLKFGLMDASGKEITEALYDYIGILSDGLMLFAAGDKYGYMDASGKMVFPLKYAVFPDYKTRANFEYGFAINYYEGKYGLINKDGKQFFPRIFKDLIIGADFPLPAIKGSKWGYITEDFQVQIPYIYDHATPFVKERAIVMMQGQYGVIDTGGHEQITVSFDEIVRLSPSLFSVTQLGLKGLMNSNGERLLPFLYSEVVLLDNGVVRVKDSKGYAYFNSTSGKFIYGSLPK